MRAHTIHPIAPPGTWHLDPAQSSVRFAVRHLAVSTVHGRFNGLDGALVFDDDGAASAQGTIAVATIDTGLPVRDARLRSADFFDVDRYPQIAFVSTTVHWLDARRLLVAGRLTIRRATRDVQFEAEMGEVAADHGKDRLALRLTGQLSQQAFGVGRRALRANRVLLGDTITFSADLSATKAPAAQAAA